MATFVQLRSGSWRVVVRRKACYVAETFRRKADAEGWALEMERRIDRGEAILDVRWSDLRTIADIDRSSYRGLAGGSQALAALEGVHS